MSMKRTKTMFYLRLMGTQTGDNTKPYLHAIHTCSNAHVAITSRTFGRFYVIEDWFIETKNCSRVV